MERVPTCMIPLVMGLMGFHSTNFMSDLASLAPPGHGKTSRFSQETTLGKLSNHCRNSEAMVELDAETKHRYRVYIYIYKYIYIYICDVCVI